MRADALQNISTLAEHHANISAQLADSESELENCETMRADALQNISTLAEHHANISAQLADSESELEKSKEELEAFKRTVGSGSIESMVKTGGTIPSEIGLFSKLHDQDLNLDDESLHGSIPSQLGMLSGLEHIYITNNNLNGNIPSQLGTLSQLKFINLKLTTSMDPSHLSWEI